MFGSLENNNTELRSDSTSGDVSEVEGGLEVTESEMNDDHSQELDGSFDKKQKSNASLQQKKTVELFKSVKKLKRKY